VTSISSVEFIKQLNVYGFRVQAKKGFGCSAGGGSGSRLNIGVLEVGRASVPAARRWSRYSGCGRHRGQPYYTISEHADHLTFSLTPETW